MVKKIQKKVTLILILILVCPCLFEFSLVNSTSGQSVSSYVILTNIDQADAYYTSVSTLQSYRGAQVIRFNSYVSECLSTLQTYKPQYVAIVVKPQTVTIDFVTDAYNAVRNIDTDGFLDSAVGFLTAANSNELLNLVNNTITAESQPKPQKYTSIVYSPTTFGGVMERSAVYGNLFASVGWDVSYVDTYNKTSDFYQRLSHCSLITIDMHGNPESVEGLSSSQVRAGPNQFLFPTVAISSPCYAANTYNVTSDCEECQPSYTINPENSFALSLIGKGAVGFIGHMEMYGPNWYLLENALSSLIFRGTSQGEAITYALNQQLGSSYIDSITHDFPQNNNWLSDAKTMLYGYVLYGDPAFKPCTNSVTTPNITSILVSGSSTYNLTLTFNRNVNLLTQNSDTVLWGYSTNWFHLQLNNSSSLNKVTISSFNDPSGKISSVSVSKWALEKSTSTNYLLIFLNFDFSSGASIPKNTLVQITILSDSPSSTLSPTPTLTPPTAISESTQTSTSNSAQQPTATNSPSPASESTTTNEPSPTVPEISTLIITLLLISMLFVAVAVKCRKQTN